MYYSTHIILNIDNQSVLKFFFYKRFKHIDVPLAKDHVEKQSFDMTHVSTEVHKTNIPKKSFSKPVVQRLGTQIGIVPIIA